MLSGESREKHEEKNHGPDSMRHALCATVEAQQPGKLFRLGFLDPSTASGAGLKRIEVSPKPGRSATTIAEGADSRRETWLAIGC